MRSRLQAAVTVWARSELNGREIGITEDSKMTEKTIGLEPDNAIRCPSFPRGKVYILPDQIEAAGTLKKFTVFFCKANIVKLQVWRPTGSDVDFSLVHEQELDVESTGTGRHEVAAPDVSVQPGDRLGITVQEGTISVGTVPSDNKVYLVKPYGEEGSFTEETSPVTFALAATYFV